MIQVRTQAIYVDIGTTATLECEVRNSCKKIMLSKFLCMYEKMLYVKNFS